MAEDLTQKLKEKYVAAISVLNRQDFKIQNIHAEGKKLVIKAEAPTKEASEQFWNAVRKIDANYADDLNAQISVSSQQQAKAKVTSPPPSPQVAPVSGTTGQQANQTGTQTTYTVEKADTLSKISQQFYGNANLYMTIFNANRDQLKDPDKIQIGQVLKIPAKPAARET